jgi:Fe2+ or Zn2+ uptake regulation protein
LSQEEVYKILKELGGKATTRQISIRAKEKFPTASLYQYVGNRLQKLEKNGHVKRTLEKREITWSIIADYPY